MHTADEVGADLIVMSTHALTGPARTLLGSVADAVVRSSHPAGLLPRRPRSEDATDNDVEALGVLTDAGVELVDVYSGRWDCIWDRRGWSRTSS
ncbi:MAG: universal stress protein [Chloroflexota bacterium]